MILYILDLEKIYTSKVPLYHLYRKVLNNERRTLKHAPKEKTRGVKNVPLLPE